jgi:chaperonin GroEL
LTGGLAILRVGAATDIERDEKKLQAEDAVVSTRLAVEGGLVAGGGVALLGCIPAVRALDLPGDEAMGVEILVRALEAPTRQILVNGGFAPNPIVAEIENSAAGRGFDVISGEFVDMWDAGIIDPLLVVRAALQTALSTAMMALTTNALVRKSEPLDSINP